MIGGVRLSWREVALFGWGGVVLSSAVAVWSGSYEAVLGLVASVAAVVVLHNHRGKQGGGA